MKRYILPLLFLVPFLLSATPTTDDKVPVAPPGCKWVFVDAGELKDGRLVKAVFLVCDPESPA